MPFEELDAMLKRRPEGVEETFRNEELAELDRKKWLRELEAAGKTTQRTTISKENE